jgi:hypothetical protein
VLLTTGLIGLSGLCILISAFKEGGRGFFWMRCLAFFFVDNRVAAFWGMGDVFLLFIYGVFWEFSEVVVIKEVLCFVVVYDDTSFSFIGFGYQDSFQKHKHDTTTNQTQKP